MAILPTTIYQLRCKVGYGVCKGKPKKSSRGLFTYYLQEFEMNIKDRARNDSTKRQIIETVRLQNAPEATSMNSRGEWKTARVPRIQIH